MSEETTDTREAVRVLGSDREYPPGSKLWKPWALDLADQVLALVAECDRYREALERLADFDYKPAAAFARAALAGDGRD